VYQSLLTRRYLLSKIMPLLSSLAVAMCTFMVLVTWSVMGGFLNQLLASGRSLMGDVAISWKYGGIPHYEDLLTRLRADPDVAAATPVIETLALLSLPDGQPKVVTVLGVEPESYHAVTGFMDTLWWKPITEPLPTDKDGNDPRLDPTLRDRLARADAAGRSLEEINPATQAPEEAAVMGAMVGGMSGFTSEKYMVAEWGFMPDERVTISVLPLSSRNVAIGMRNRSYPVANEFRSGFFMCDANWVIVPLRTLQTMLAFESVPRFDPEWRPGRVVLNEQGEPTPEEPPIIGVEPARVSHIYIRARDGVTPEMLEPRVEAIFEAFINDHPGLSLPMGWRRAIYPWDRKPEIEHLVAAVKKETGLVLLIFGFISFTAVFLVLAIFWAMVSEKTKDIGTLRAIGASRAGITWLWLRYGLSIGVVGSVIGVAIACLVVWNINPIHEWMGRALGLQVWDPSVYYFVQIPNQVEPTKALLVVGVGMLSCLLGALVPALRAAWMDPVKALRFE